MILVDLDPLLGGLKLRLEQRDTFGELRDARGERSDDVIGSVHAAFAHGGPPFFLLNSPRVGEMYTILTAKR